MTPRTITIPAPEWEADDNGHHLRLTDSYPLAFVEYFGREGKWRAFLVGQTREFNRYFPDLPSAKAWAEKRALELLGAKP